MTILKTAARETISGMIFVTVQVSSSFLLFLFLIQFNVMFALNFIMQAFRRIGWDAQRL